MNLCMVSYLTFTALEESALALLQRSCKLLSLCVMVTIHINGGYGVSFGTVVHQRCTSAFERKPCEMLNFAKYYHFTKKHLLQV